MKCFQVERGIIKLCAAAGELTQTLAQRFVQIAQESARQRGRFMVALSGGSTPKALFELLAQAEFANRISWHDTHIFWGDERCVPHQSDQSNYKMANEAFLSKVPIPASNIHPTVGQSDNPQRSAELYEASIKTIFNAQDSSSVCFDLILLGLGPEGHTASLFPGSPALLPNNCLVMPVYVEALKAYRITFTPTLINQSRHIIFMVSGAGKSDILPQVLEPGEILPAQFIYPIQGTLEWFVDEPAACKLDLTAASSL